MDSRRHAAHVGRAPKNDGVGGVKFFEPRGRLVHGIQFNGSEGNRLRSVLDRLGLQWGVAVGSMINDGLASDRRKTSRESRSDEYPLPLSGAEPATVWPPAEGRDERPCRNRRSAARRKISRRNVPSAQSRREDVRARRTGIENEHSRLRRKMLSDWDDCGDGLIGCKLVHGDPSDENLRGPASVAERKGVYCLLSVPPSYTSPRQQHFR